MKIDISESTEILVFTGPECSGKTTSSKRIARKFRIPRVVEYAREYLTGLGREYSFVDIQLIANHQIEKEKTAHQNYPLIICDTDLITLEIWAVEKFGKSLELVDDFLNKKHYLLCYPDIPWEPDPLRENPDDRERLFEVYKRHLQMLNVTFTVLDANDRNELCFQLKGA